MTQGHPHAKLAVEYWTIAMTDPEAWKRIRGRRPGTTDWVGFKCEPSFLENWEYEIIPAVLNNNGHEFPEPLRVAPAVGATYWLALPHGGSLACRLSWGDNPADCIYLRRGLIHLTKEAAEAHARADILAAGGEL